MHVLDGKARSPLMDPVDAKPAGGAPCLSFDETLDADGIVASAYSCASAFTRTIDIACPDVVPFDGQGRRILGPGAPEAFREGRFFAAFVPGGIGGTLIVNVEMAARLPMEAIPPLVAHEMGHAADWFLMARVSLLSLLPGGRRRLSSPTSPLGPEIFADRVAAHLVGTRALRLLYLSSLHVQGLRDGSQARMLARLASLPERPGLPPSLRMRLSLRKLARLHGA